MVAVRSRLDGRPARRRSRSADATPTVRPLDVDALSRLRVAPRVVSPFDPVDVHALLAGRRWR